MRHILPFPGRPAPRGDGDPRPALSRRWLAAPLLSLLTIAALMLTPAVAGADTSSTLTVVGTSDLSDSGLMTSLIGPAFMKAYPQFTFKYIGTATGTAISNAESGSVGASVLIVHAPSLENQFVANGFSNEKYGRAMFTNDFVFAGPSGDPAGVGANAATQHRPGIRRCGGRGDRRQGDVRLPRRHPGHDRGGASDLGARPERQPGAARDCCCAPSTPPSGGGETPIAAGNGVTASGQPCPNGGALPTAGALPAWYVATGLTQGPNVLAANACTGLPSGANCCYVLTDRGTFDYLASGTDPAGRDPQPQDPHARSPARPLPAAPTS